MQISTKAWVQYITKMAKISQKAADLMQAYVQKHGFDDDKALLDYAFALSQRYGQAIGSLSCSMYEATAAAQGVTVPTAEMADLPEYGEVAKAVHGTMKRSPVSVPSTVARLVKQVGADTTLKNAMRDGAQFAWVPHGDTCSFCITLASRGWQYMSKQALKNGHAEHIHANCDCQYAVRFDGKSGVGGYDPDKYLAQYNAAGGDINAMRRMRYKDNKDAINARKRELYAERKTLNKHPDSGLVDVKSEYLKLATPGIGFIKQDINYDSVRHSDEIKTAQWLHENLGGDIVLLNEANNYKIMTPDYLWNGKMWDLKLASTEKSANSAVRHGLKQIQKNPGGIILNYEKNEISVDILKEVLEKRLNASATQNVDIIVLANNKLLTVQRFIRKK